MIKIVGNNAKIMDIIIMVYANVYKDITDRLIGLNVNV